MWRGCSLQGGNPTFRVYELQAAPKWDVTDYVHFYLPLSEYHSRARWVERPGTLNWVRAPPVRRRLQRFPSDRCGDRRYS